MHRPPDPLLDTGAAAAARTGVLNAIRAGHRVVLLLGCHPRLNTALMQAVSRDLTAAGRAVHTVAGALRRADLADPDPNIVVAIDDADRLARPSLLALDEHLRAPAATQLLLAASPSFPALTATPGLARLHFAPLVVTLGRLSPEESASYLRARGARPRPAILRAAAGDPAALDRFARSTLAALAEAPPFARLLDRPAILASFAALLALASFGANMPLALHPPAPSKHPAILPPIAAPDPSTGLVTDSTGPETGDSAVIVDHEDPDDRLSPHLVAPPSGEPLAATYARIYRGLASPPSLATVRALNAKPAPGSRLIFPAPPEGWPTP